MADSNGSQVLRFGVFEINLRARELRKHGVRVRLPGQAFSVLAMLLEHPGEIVTREELSKRLWPAETFVDFEQGLNGTIKKLRTALNDSADQPRYVETLPRIGYRFVAPVEEKPENGHVVTVEKPFNNQGTQLSPAPLHPRRRWTDKARTPVLAVAAALLSVSVARSVFTPPQPAISVLGAVRLTASSRVDRWGRLFNDGQRIFFLERRGSVWNSSQVASTGGDSQPFPVPFQNTRILSFSPANSEFLIAPFTSRADPLALYRMPAIGGPPLRVGEISALDATFSPDGREIAFSDSEGIWLVGLDGIRPRQLLKLPGIKNGLGWSPDGRTIRFTQEIHEHEILASSTILELNVDGSSLHPLLPGWERTPQQCCGRWTPDGHYYFFVSHDHDGSQGIWAISERPNVLQKVPPPILIQAGPIVFDQPLPSSDGKHLFALGSNGSHEYAMYDVRTNRTHSLFGGSGPARWVSFDPSGTWAVCVGDNTDIWRSNLDGSQRTSLVPASFHPHLPRISPDGSQVVFQGFQSPSENWTLYSVPAKGGTPRGLTSGASASQTPEWAPDGSKLAYAESAFEDGPYFLSILDLETGVTTKISGSEGLYRSFWSPNGKFLVGSSDDGKRLMLLNVAAKHWTTLATGKLFGSPTWSPDSRFIYTQDLLEKDQPVRRLNISTRQSERIDVCGPLLEGDVQRCGLEGGSAQGNLLLRLTHGDHDIYSLELSLP